MLDILIGVGIVWVSQIVWAIRQRTKRPKPPKPIAAECGCEHHYSMHDPETKQCHAEERFKVNEGRPILDSDGDYVIGREGATYEVRQCGCRRYTGPEPLPSYYAPEIAS